MWLYLSASTSYTIPTSPTTASTLQHGSSDSQYICIMPRAASHQRSPAPLQACTADGTVYDVVNIVTYVQKFKRHPVNGEPLSLKDIITLQYHKNADGEYHCPVLNKVFTESTHIVAIRNTGNVYCYEVCTR